MLRHPIQIMRTPLTDDERRTILIVMSVALIALIPSVIGISLVWHQGSVNHRLAIQNKRLIHQLDLQAERFNKVAMEQTTARIENRRRFAATDRANCLEIEKLKRQVRAVAAFDLGEFKLTLEQLGVDPDSEQGKVLIERSRKAAAKTLERFKPRPGGCASLPSQGVREPNSGG